MTVACPTLACFDSEKKKSEDDLEHQTTYRVRILRSAASACTSLISKTGEEDYDPLQILPSPWSIELACSTHHEIFSLVTVHPLALAQQDPPGRDSNSVEVLVLRHDRHEAAVCPKSCHSMNEDEDIEKFHYLYLHFDEGSSNNSPRANTIPQPDTPNNNITDASYWRHDLARALRLETLIETRVDIVSTGPDRNETIVLNELISDSI